MDHFVNFLVTLFLVCSIWSSNSEINSNFNENYYVVWGDDHVIRNNNGSIVQLYMDKQHGGAGFESKHSYGSGFFQMRIKLPGKEAAGVVTSYYLTSENENKHNEFDFEFLGNREGKAYTLSTNIYIDGEGGREQRFDLWFDPTSHFHTYKILWNQFHIVFFVDDMPIRELKNDEKYIINYPRKAMKIVSSIWDGEDWATDGGQTKTNWSCAPFRGYFEGFDVDGCYANAESIESCNGDNYWWNEESYMELNPTERKAYEVMRANYLNYDYCTDKPRYPVPPPECNHH